jgi:hypothetical protein
MYVSLYTVEKPREGYEGIREKKRKKKRRDEGGKVKGT